ncbi:MAG TPA: EamA family transporter [Acidimicrobiales bacterium]|nr:EamA family transporter [Acidimicrobiales bacterium]
MRRDGTKDGERRAPGLLLAGATALVSGVSVFVNGYGVRALPDAALYTTAKNVVAAVLLALAVVAFPSLRRRAPDSSDGGGGGRAADRPPGGGRATSGGLARALGLAYVAAVGGGVAFVLFFTGLARSAAEPAAFVHDTLVIWVGVVAWGALRERLSTWNLVAIAALVAGQVLAAGGVGGLAGAGGLGLVLAATLLWAVEVVVAKRLLATVTPGAIALVRMGGGSALLVCYLALDNKLAALSSLDARQLSWVLATGALLAVYVATWFAALARARAVDVTSVLAASVVVTAALQALAGRSGLPSEPAGLALVVLGAATVWWRWPRRVLA